MFNVGLRFFFYGEIEGSVTYPEVKASANVHCIGEQDKRVVGGDIHRLHASFLFFQPSTPPDQS